MAFVQHLKLRNRADPDLSLSYANKTGVLNLSFSASFAKRIGISVGDTVNFYYDDGNLKNWKIEKNLTDENAYKVVFGTKRIRVNIKLKIPDFNVNDISLKSYAFKDKCLYITLN